MPTIRDTKAKILAHAHALEAQIEKGPEWPDILAKLAQTAAAVAREARLLVLDTCRAGQACRVWYDQAVADLSRPILRKP